MSEFHSKLDDAGNEAQVPEDSQLNGEQLNDW